MAHFARALQRCGKIAGVAATSVAATAYCDAAINKKDFTPLIVARNDKMEPTCTRSRWRSPTRATRWA